MGKTVYGPADFTVGADVNLDTFDPNWEKVQSGATDWSGIASVRAATDDLRNITVSSTAAYRWMGRTLKDQSIRGKLLASASDYPGWYVRLSGTPGVGYLVEWQATENTIALYRVTEPGGVPTFTPLQNFGAVADGVTYLGAMVKATGVNPVIITYGDATNGYRTFVDSSAPISAGQPGFSIFNPVALAVALDDIMICDETPEAVGPPLLAPQLMGVY